MTPIATTHDIRPIPARPAADGTWRVRFRSPHEGCHHQLYLNGRLAAWTDSPAQRSFTLPAGQHLRQVVIAAVFGQAATRDCSAELGITAPPWVCEVRVVRSPSLARTDRVQLLGDGTTGSFLPEPLAVRPAWSPPVPRWAWGEDAFARGAFGYDGSAAPGAGQGAFGAGLFGFDERLISLTACLDVPGTCMLKLRTVRPDGSAADGEPFLVNVSPPPEPPAALEPCHYAPDTQTLTLRIRGDLP
jgi:hypothetical protein